MPTRLYEQVICTVDHHLENLLLPATAGYPLGAGWGSDFKSILGGGLFAGGQPTQAKPFGTRGSSEGTSAISQAARKIPGKLPFRVPTPTTRIQER